MTAEEPEWKLAWQRSLALQRHLRTQGKPGYYLDAQFEHDYCQAVSETPRDQIPPTAKEWFREDVPVPRAAAVAAPKPTPDLHAVRVADAPTAERAGAAPVMKKLSIWRNRLESMDRWQEIAKDRGGSYWQQVQFHLWALAYVVIGVIIGAFSVKSSCP